MRKPDEGLIHQWLDGECSPEEAAQIERLVASDPTWAAAVAEARGLIAASSRIVGALDAVSHARPAGSAAAPVRRTVVRPWLRMAAALVLVAGTAYVLRERAREPFDAPAPAPVPAEEPAPTAAPVTAPSVEARVEARVAASQGVAAAAPPPVVAAPAPAAPSAAAAALATDSAMRAGRRRELERSMQGARAQRALSEVVVTGVTAEKTADAPAAAAMPADTMALEGCWTVLAPSDMISLLVRPKYRAVAADSLVLRVQDREFGVRRDGDRLSGALAARRVPCPEP